MKKEQGKSQKPRRTQCCTTEALGTVCTNSGFTRKAVWQIKHMKVGYECFQDSKVNARSVNFLDDAELGGKVPEKWV